MRTMELSVLRPLQPCWHFLHDRWVIKNNTTNVLYSRGTCFCSNEKSVIRNIWKTNMCSACVLTEHVESPPTVRLKKDKAFGSWREMCLSKQSVGKLLYENDKPCLDVALEGTEVSARLNKTHYVFHLLEPRRTIVFCNPNVWRVLIMAAWVFKYELSFYLRPSRIMFNITFYAQLTLKLENTPHTY